MMPYDTYRLYRVEHAKCPREIHGADQRAARLASAVPALLRAIARSRLPGLSRRWAPQPIHGACRPQGWPTGATPWNPQGADGA